MSLEGQAIICSCQPATSSMNFLVLLKNFYEQAWPWDVRRSLAQQCFRFKWSEVNLMVSRHLCLANSLPRWRVWILPTFPLTDFLLQWSAVFRICAIFA